MRGGKQQAVTRGVLQPNHAQLGLIVIEIRNQFLLALASMIARGLSKGNFDRGIVFVITNRLLPPELMRAMRGVFAARVPVRAAD